MECVNCPGAIDHSTADCPLKPQASAEIPFGGFDPNFCPGSNPDNPQTEEHEPEQPGAAQPAPVVPAGYVMVPVKPTPEMVRAAEEAYMPFGDMDIALRMGVLAAAPAQGQQVEWRTTAVMLEQANAGLAQLNGKLRAELSALKAQQVGQEPAGEVHLRKGGGISLLHVELAQPLPPGTKLYTAPQPAPSQDVAGLASSDPVAKAEFETRLRKEFESRWPKPKGVTWGAGINDYCVSEFAEGIALSYPDMWMAYKAGAMRTNQ